MRETRLQRACDLTIQLILGERGAISLLSVCIVGLLGRDRNLRGGDMDRGSVFRRCGCRDQATGMSLGARCPRFSSPRHGT
jgi:hypothetical protein